MKKLGFSISLAVVAIMIVAWLAIDRALDRYESREWPAGLGRLSSVPSRNFSRDANDEAKRVVALAAPLMKGIPEALSPYLKQELERGTDEVAPPPPVVAEFLATHRTELDQLRNFLLSASSIQPSVSIDGDRRYARIPSAEISRLLVTRAIAQSYFNDPRAWDDLHAVWILDRSLWEVPVYGHIALAVARMVNGAAMKLPEPHPPWIDEMKSIDYRLAYASATQVTVWSEQRWFAELAHERDWRRSATLPLLVLSLDDDAEKVRLRTAALLGSRACDLAHDPLGAPLPFAPWNVSDRHDYDLLVRWWGDLSRFHAELEAREKFSALRRGLIPDARTQCSDGSWIVRPQSIEFSRDISASGQIHYPLSLRRSH